MGRSKQELLDAEAAAAAEIGALVSPRTSDAVTAEDLNDGGWSVRSLIVHIAHWQEAGAHVIEYDLGEYDGDDEMDRTNDVLLDAARALTWEQALEKWARARPGITVCLGGARRRDARGREVVHGRRHRSHDGPPDRDAALGGPRGD